MTSQYKQLSFAKTVLAFFIAGPPLYGLEHSVLSLVMESGYVQLPSLLVSAAFASSQMLATVLLFIFGMVDGYAWKFLYLPTLLAGSVFWAVRKQVTERCIYRSQRQCLIASAVFGSFISVAAFIAANLTIGTGGWKDFYFYRPQDKTVPDYSEWGFLDVYGLLFHWTCIAWAGFGLGLFFGPKEFAKSDGQI